MSVRFAREDELERVNELRHQVNDLHVAGKPEVFKPGFSDALRNYIYTVFNHPQKKVIVCERAGVICGFAILGRILKPESPYTYAKDSLDIDEFGVDESCRRQGVGTEMVAFIRDFAAKEGFGRIELNMWEFNQDALEFYEGLGFKTYRRYMEIDV